jgi:hypothetical protein
MSEQKPTEEEKFDAILRRMLATKPLTKAEISARIKADREERKKAKSVRKMDEK